MAKYESDQNGNWAQVWNVNNDVINESSHHFYKIDIISKDEILLEGGGNYSAIYDSNGNQIAESRGIDTASVDFNKTTNGIFAPWALYKKDFWDVGGHDLLFAPTSREDSDIFNRLLLNGCKFIQTWEGFVYHMTCRGSRFKDGALRNPAGQVFMKGRESSEWLEQNLRSTRNFIRKWGHMVKHDSMMYPIIPPKYNIGFIVKNCDFKHVNELEPWCSTLYCEYTGVIESYIKHEQKNTAFDLSKRLKHDYSSNYDNDILIEFDAQKLTADNFQVIVNLSEMLKDSGEVGKMEYDIYKFDIKSMKTYERDLINVV